MRAIKNRRAFDKKRVCKKQNWCGKKARVTLCTFLGTEGLGSY